MKGRTNVGVSVYDGRRGGWNAYQGNIRDMTKVPSSALIAHLQPDYGTAMSTFSVKIMNVQIHTTETRSVLTLEQTD
jgi:hypothetical protein